jgi:hypothetical protein
MRRTYVITGVNTAISLLRPGALYQMSGSSFSQWNDPRPIPTWEEIEKTMIKLKKFEDEIPSIELE